MNSNENTALNLRLTITKGLIILCLGALANIVAYFYLPRVDAFLFGLIHRFTIICSIPIILGVFFSTKLDKSTNGFWELINGLALVFNGFIILCSLIILFIGLSVELTTILAWPYFFVGISFFYFSIKKTERNREITRATSKPLEKWRGDILDDEAFLNSES